MKHMLNIAALALLCGCACGGDNCGDNCGARVYDSSKADIPAWLARTGANVDESKADCYAKLDILKTPNGREIETYGDWLSLRPEVERFFAEKIYGEPLPRPQKLEFKLLESGELPSINAERRQYKIFAENGGKTFAFHVLIYMPKNAKAPVPVFVSPNFAGNHAVWNDPAIILPSHYLKNNQRVGISDNKAHDSQRGKNAWRHPIDKIVSAGFAIATFCYCEVFPDKPDGAKDSVYNIYPPRKKGTAIPAWAWGNCRALDLLETIPEIDASKAVVIGHSRLGKTAIYSGVYDKRFAAVVSNGSGCMGTATNRRNFGETLGFMAKAKNLNYWFVDEMAQFSGANIEKMPFDQAHLLACIAPRPLYVESATNDVWADPKGEYISLCEAAKIYALFGAKNLPEGDVVYIEKPFHGDVGHHLREGNHDIVEYDWVQFLKFFYPGRF